MVGDRVAQFGQAEHRRILVPAVEHRFGRLGAHVGRAWIVGEALAEIDRIALARQPRHHLEDAGANIGENRIHERLARLNLEAVLAENFAAGYRGARYESERGCEFGSPVLGEWTESHTIMSQALRKPATRRIIKAAAMSLAAGEG